MSPDSIRGTVLCVTLVIRLPSMDIKLNKFQTDV
jgi:hypothetical protein